MILGMYVDSLVSSCQKEKEKRKKNLILGLEVVWIRFAAWHGCHAYFTRVGSYLYL